MGPMHDGTDSRIVGVPQTGVFWPPGVALRFLDKTAGLVCLGFTKMGVGHTPVKLSGVLTVLALNASLLGRANGEGGAVSLGDCPRET